MISVIVPVYRVEPYLQRCVNSILAQTYMDFVLWLVDDGSPDGCGRLCDEYARQDSRILVIHKENGGLSDARNKALDIISGQYICFVDSDDWIPTDSLESMLYAMERNGSDMAIGNMIDVYDDGDRKDGYCPYYTETIVEGERIFETLVKPCAPNRLYKSYIFSTLRYPVGKLFEDVFIFHDVLAQVNKIVFTGKENYYYFIRKDSIMHTAYTARNMDIIEAISLRAKAMERMGQPELAIEAKVFTYSQLSAAYAFLDRNDREGIKRRKEYVRLYRSYYPELMKSKKNNWKQKTRMTILLLCPLLHTFLWGKRMPYNLG